MYVPFFRCESFPYISRRADWCPCSSFPSHSPCTPLVFISVPCMSLSVPLCFPFISRCFPVMSTSYFLSSFPCTSLHFAFSQLGRPKTQSFSRFSAKGGRNPKPAKSRQGESSLGPLFCDTGSPKTTLSGTSSNCRPPPPPTYQMSGEGGGVGGAYPLSSLRCPTRRAMSADIYACIHGHKAPVEALYLTKCRFLFN